MRTRSCFLFAFTVVSLCLAAQTKPVGGGGSGGRTTNIPSFSRPSNHEVRLEIQVTYENSQPLSDTPLLVEVGTLSGPQQRTYLDSNGRATFSVPGGANYQLTITGSEVETTTSTFELYPDELNHRENIAVKFKEDAKNSRPGGMVSAANLRIPSKARNEFSKGMEDMDKNKWDSAKKHFEKAIQEYPTYDWAYNNLGVVEMQLKNTDAARQAFSKAVELNDKNADASVNLAQLKVNDNDYEGAKTLLQKAVTIKPKSSKCLMLLAFAEYRTNELDAALSNAEKVHQGDPDQYPLAHFLAAQIREGRGDLAGAERQYETYLKEAPDGPQASLAKEALIRANAKN